MLGIVELFTAINISSIQAVVDDYGTGHAIFIDELVPSDFTGKKSVNCYLTANYDPSLEIDYYKYSASCRAETGNESRIIAQAVIDGINRVSYSDYYISCKLLPVIRPQDDTDTYNSPVEIIIKKW